MLTARRPLAAWRHTWVLSGIASDRFTHGVSVPFMSAEQNPTPPLSAPRRGVSAWWRALSILLLIVILLAWAAATSMTTQLQAQIEQLQARLIQVQIGRASCRERV